MADKNPKPVLSNYPPSLSGRAAVEVSKTGVEEPKTCTEQDRSIQKSLGCDPFEGMEDWDWAEKDLAAEQLPPSSSPSFGQQEQKNPPGQSPPLAVEAEIEVCDTDAKGRIQNKTAAPSKIKAAPGAKDSQTSAPPEPGPGLEATIETEDTPLKPEIVSEVTTEAAANPKPVLSVAEVSKIKNQKSEVTTEAIANPKPVLSVAEVSKIQNPKSEAADHLLDDLVIAIDEEIKQIFGSALMINLGAGAPVDRRGNEEQYIIFTLAGTKYAAPAANVREVGEIVDLTPVPNVPVWLLGVTNLRGDILSVVDLRAFLGIAQLDYIESSIWSESSPGGERQMLVVHPAKDASFITTGLVVDEVSDIRHLVVNRISMPAAPIEDQMAPYLRGLYDDEGRLLVVLDFERLLLSSKMRQFEPA